MDGRYGPQTEEVERLVLLADDIDPERIAEIAEAYRSHGLPHARFALAAAKIARRETPVRLAGLDMSSGIHLAAMVREYEGPDVRLAAWAARNVGIGVATEDLIGTAGYSIREYASLVDPWFAGFRDQPVGERKEEE